jgi:Zn-dependent protease
VRQLSGGRTWSLSLGRIAGIPLRLHLSFLVWVLLIVGSGGASSPHVLAASVGWLAVVFGSVILHELSHSLVARRLGAKVAGVMLLPFGGVSQISAMPDGAAPELAVSAAGPAFSLVLGAAAGLAAAATGASLLPPAISTGPLLVRIAWLNILLAGFNMLPAFPLDGGRVFRAALSMRVGRSRATHVAARLGRLLGAAMILLGLLGDFWLALIGAFIFMSATSQARADLANPTLGVGAVDPATLRVGTVDSAMLPVPWTVEVGETPTEVTALEACRRQGLLPVVDDGRYVGVIGPAEAGRLESAPGVTAGAVADRQAPAVTPWATLEVAAGVIAGSGRAAAAVTSANGHVVGVIRHVDLLGAPAQSR